MEFQWNLLLKRCPSCILPYTQGQARETVIFTSAMGSVFHPKTAFCGLAQPSTGSDECREPGSSSSLRLLVVPWPCWCPPGERERENETENNSLGAGREHVRAGSSLPGCPLSETRLPLHFYHPKLGNIAARSVTLHQC